MNRTRLALLSNPRSTGNVAQLPRVRAYCAAHPDIFHYEVERVEQIGEALKTIARVNPVMLVINGGDGTVQAALTELHNGRYFGEEPPPVAVLPSGKTNLIALDLGVHGDPIAALERLVTLAQGEIRPHLVPRELIALRQGGSEKPVVGMFLGGAGLADTMLYCRHKIYPLGLPNGISHFLAALATMVRQMFGLRMSFLPPPPAPLILSLHRDGKLTGRFALILVTTLEKLLLTSQMGEERAGRLKLLAVEYRPLLLLRAFAASIRGRLDRTQVRGIHFEGSDEISIEGDASDVILDGETFRAEIGRPILLRPTPPLSFVRLAA